MPELDFEARWKSFHAVKQALEDKMRGGRKHLRALLVDRVLLQHQVGKTKSYDHLETCIWLIMTLYIRTIM